jgi:hypothetical protein
LQNLHFRDRSPREMATQLWRRVCYVLSMLLNPNPLTEQVIGCAINVHRALGPGSLESAYRRCFSHELTMQGIAFKSEVAVPIVYRGARIECGYRADIVIKESCYWNSRPLTSCFRSTTRRSSRISSSCT